MALVVDQTGRSTFVLQGIRTKATIPATRVR